MISGQAEIKHPGRRPRLHAAADDDFVAGKEQQGVCIITAAEKIGGRPAAPAEGFVKGAVFPVADQKKIAGFFSAVGVAADSYYIP